MLKQKQIDAILDMYQLDVANSDKLSAIAELANNQKNKLLNIVFDTKLNLEEKLLKIKDSVKSASRKLKRNSKWGQILGTGLLILYSLLQTLGVF